MTDFELHGGCTCRAVRYRITRSPLIVHCCHCRWCQRETGSAFVLNAVVEADSVELEGAAPELVNTPSASGKGQKISRCPTCRVALFSNYAGSGDAMRFVRIGTLDNPDALAPDVHIYTESKVPWVALPPGVPAFPKFYDPKQVWSDAARERFRAARARPA
jgi:hypothetical protein